MIIELDRAEAAEMFADLAMRHLGISGQEFLRRWDAGHYAGRTDDPLVEVWKVMGLVR